MARPADACPYHKPFLADFADCPAFQPRQFIPLDTLNQPLQPVLTCRHLQTRSSEPRHRWYGACALGDPAARRRWAMEVGTGRLARIRELQRQMACAMGPEIQRLWRLKGQQLQAFRSTPDAGAVTAELRQVSDRALTDLDTFLTAHQPLLAEVGVPLDAMTQVMRFAFTRFIETRYSSEVSLEVPDSILEGLSAPVRTFFRPATTPASPPLA